MLYLLFKTVLLLSCVFCMLGSKHLAQTNPLVCWFCSMLSSFAGTFMANFLLGQSILAPFSNHFNIGLATIVW